MDIETEQKFVDLEVKLNAIQKSVEQTRKYMTFTFWVTIAVFVLPLLALVIVVPMVLNSYTSALGI